MRSAIGNSLLLNLVIIFVSLIILFFVGILSYSKAYRIKNRIVEIIEKNEVYDDEVSNYIYQDLEKTGYSTALPNCNVVKSHLEEKGIASSLANLNTKGYNYCVYEITNNPTNPKVLNGKYYIVVTFIKFEFPVIGNFINIPVYGETKILGKTFED